MLTTIKGIYVEGKIILQEDAPLTNRAKVIITFLDDETDAPKKGKRIAGRLKGKIGIPDDFNEPLDDLKDYM